MKNQVTEPSVLLSLSQCAQLTGESRKSWQRRIAAREVEYVSLGPRRIRVPRTEVDRLVASRTVKAIVRR